MKNPAAEIRIDLNRVSVWAAILGGVASTAMLLVLMFGLVAASPQDVLKVSQDVAKVRNEIVDVRIEARDQYNKVNDSVVALREEMTAALEGIDKRFDRIEKRLDAIAPVPDTPAPVAAPSAPVVAPSELLNDPDFKAFLTAVIVAAVQEHLTAATVKDGP